MHILCINFTICGPHHSGREEREEGQVQTVPEGHPREPAGWEMMHLQQQHTTFHSFGSSTSTYIISIK